MSNNRNENTLLNVLYDIENERLKERISNGIKETESLSSDYMSTTMDENFKSWDMKIREPIGWTKEKFEMTFPLMGLMTMSDWRQTKQSMTLNGEELYVRGLSEFYEQKFGEKPNLEVN